MPAVLYMSALAVWVLLACVGFLDGWRAGWRLARGRSIKETLSDTIAMKCVDRLKRRRS